MSSGAPFWIHCNICNALFGKDENNKHYLLSCTHVVCRYCIRNRPISKCPLDKQPCKMLDMAKLPDHLKRTFNEDIAKLMKGPMKTVDIRQNHMRHMMKLTREYRAKTQQLLKAYEKEKEETLKLKAKYEAARKQRMLMQQRLKEIYMRNQMKRKQEIYRNQLHATPSTDVSMSKREPSQGTPSFFNPSVKSTPKSFFVSRKSSSHEVAKKSRMHHTQSDRSPFFL